MQHLEDLHQVVVMDWARARKIPGTSRFYADYLIHIPNGGKRNKREAGRLKRQGVKAGVSDLFFAYPVGEYCGLWIEMKPPIVPGKQKPKVQETQKDWIELMVQQGFDAAVCFGSAQAIAKLEKYTK